MKKRPRYSDHFVYWLVAAIFLIWFYTKLTREYQHTLLLASVVWCVSISVVYFFNHFLIPRYLFPNRYFRFVIFSVYSLVISVWISLFITLLYFSLLLTQSDGMEFPFRIDLAFLLAGQFLVVAAGVLLHAVRENIRMIRRQNELELQRVEILAKLKESELRFLKSQFHPHFLFNTLNNLYSLSLRKSDQAPEMILKLSELLDYSLHRAEADRIPLSEEIQFIENYCELTRMRFGKAVILSFEAENQDPAYPVPPMILLPFVENAIKHGIHPEHPESFVRITVVQDNHGVRFETENRVFGLKPDQKVVDGIGLSHVRNRLELIMPGKYKLNIKQTKGLFTVNLTLNG